jgi:hypothetical protein
LLNPSDLNEESKCAHYAGTAKEDIRCETVPDPKILMLAMEAALPTMGDRNASRQEYVPQCRTATSHPRLALPSNEVGQATRDRKQLHAKQAPAREAIVQTNRSWQISWFFEKNTFERSIALFAEYCYGRENCLPHAYP